MKKRRELEGSFRIANEVVVQSKEGTCRTTCSLKDPILSLHWCLASETNFKFFLDKNASLSLKSAISYLVMTIIHHGSRDPPGSSAAWAGCKYVSARHFVSQNVSIPNDS